MHGLARDLKYAWRGLGRAPAFAAIAIITLALGIGANTAIFSIIYAALLRPLPYQNPGELVRLYETEDAPGNYPFAGPDYLDWKAQNHSFADMATFSYGQDINLSGAGQPDHVIGTHTEANFFSVLGVRPLLGRTFVAGENEPGHDRVVILSYGLWRSKFDADPKVVGRQIELNDRKYDVIGVMSGGFHFPSRAQLWVPLDMSAKNMGHRGSHWLNAIGRLKPDVSLQQAQAEMALIAAQLEKQYPDSNHKVGASLVGMHEDLVGDSRASLFMMLGAVVLVLLIACANVANLLLSRAIGRQKEFAIRGALGANRMRLVRQLLAESALLAIAGGAFGLLLAWGGVRLISALKHVGLPQANAIEINLPVLAFTLTVALLTSLGFGLGSSAAKLQSGFIRGNQERCGKLGHNSAASQFSARWPRHRRSRAFAPAADLRHASAQRFPALAQHRRRSACRRHLDRICCPARGQVSSAAGSASPSRRRCLKKFATSPASSPSLSAIASRSKVAATAT